MGKSVITYPVVVASAAADDVLDVLQSTVDLLF